MQPSSSASHTLRRRATESARFVTFAELLRAYPGGLRGLAEAIGASHSTLRRIRDTAFATLPRRHLRQLATVGGWTEVVGMNRLDHRRREARLVWHYRRARRYPECGHSVCSQHFIDTGITACIEAASRRAGLLGHP